MIGPEAARAFLRTNGWLSRTPESFQDAALAKAVLKYFEPGATVVVAGDEPRGLFGLAAGGLRASVVAEETAAAFAHYFQPGAWLGEYPALTGRRHVVGLQAARETCLLHIPTHALNEILRADPVGWRYLGQLLAEHSERSIGVISDLMRRDHAQRFVAILLRLSGHRPPAEESADHFDIDFSQEELAAITNLARTTVNGLLSSLQEKGFVDLSYRRIRVVNAEKMLAMLMD